MIGAVIVYGIVVAGVLAPAVWLADRALAMARRPRRGVWAAALVLAIGLPIVSPWRTPTVGPGEPTPDAGGAVATFRAVTLASGTSQTLGWISSAAAPWAGVGWALASLGLGVVFLSGGLLLARRRRRWHRHATHPDVFVSDRIGPAVVGLFRPAIVVPAWVMRLDATALAFVLRHEREHVRAGDAWLVHGAAAAVVLMPWNPFVWWMASRLRLAVEMDCDARVLAGERDRSAGVVSYGEVLLAIAGRIDQRRVWMPAMIEAPSSLARRITAMCDSRIRFGRLQRLLATAGAAVLLLAACNAPVPDNAAEPSPNVSAGPWAGREVVPEPAAPASSTAETAPPGVTGGESSSESDSIRRFRRLTVEGVREVEPDATPTLPEAQVVRPGPGVANPTVIRDVRPSYTSGAMQRKVEGKVALEAVVDAEGTVVGVEVLRSLDPELDAEAVKAARQWQFRPATVDGKPVSIIVMLEFGFALH